jgi:hypothetical protein
VLSLGAPRAPLDNRLRWAAGAAEGTPNGAGMAAPTGRLRLRVELGPEEVAAPLTAAKVRATAAKQPGHHRVAAPLHGNGKTLGAGTARAAQGHAVDNLEVVAEQGATRTKAYGCSQANLGPNGARGVHSPFLSHS